LTVKTVDSKAISKKAQEYRKIMSKTLQEACFVNYPMEYWHWSYGDRYFAYQNHKKYAIYNMVLGETNN